MYGRKKKGVACIHTKGANLKYPAEECQIIAVFVRSMITR